MQPIKAVLTPVVAISEILVRHTSGNMLGPVLDVYGRACDGDAPVRITDEIFMSWLEDVCICNDGDDNLEARAWLDAALHDAVNSED